MLFFYESLKSFRKVFFHALLILIPIINLSAESIYTPDEINNTEVFEQAQKSVVHITNKKIQRDFFSFDVHEIPAGSGTGIVWNKSGIIVTNFHVIYQASSISVILYDNSVHEAKPIGFAPSKDLAILQLQNLTPPLVNKLEPIKLADSNQLKVGLKALAIGNPFGLNFSLTVGVISALGREIKSLNGRKIHGVIQTDAAINPGNSGGPLLNSAAELIGINTAIESPNGTSSGIGFAIPVNTIKKIIPQLIQHGKIIRPMLGIHYADSVLTARLNIEGIIVMDVIPNSPAAKVGMVGLQIDQRGYYYLGDIILQINQQRIKNTDDLYTFLEKHRPGDIVKVKTLRNKKMHYYQVELISEDYFE